MRCLLQLAQRILVGDPRTLAREAERRAWLAGDRDARQFAAQLAPRPGSDDVGVGHVTLRDGRRKAVALTRGFLRQSHLAIPCGSTGSGKTTMAVEFLDRVLDDPGERLLAIDPKGDVSSALRERYFPARAAGPDGGAFAARLRYLRAFAGGQPPPLRLTLPEPGVAPNVQAMSLGVALAEVAGVELSLPAVHTFAKLARVAIERGAALTEIVRWIARPELFARIACNSRDEEIRQFGAHGFQHEHKGVLRSLKARIEGVLLLPSVRAALEAPGCIDFARSLEEHHLLIDLSNPPAGEEAAVRMLGGPLIGRFTRAILNRRLHADSPHVWLAIDEVQEVLTNGGYEASSLDRILALSRARRVSLLTINQLSAQLPRRLREAIRANTGAELFFRASEADAKLLSTVLPVPEDAERPSEARRALIRRIMGLKRREAALWVKTARVPLGFIRAPKVDFDELDRRAARLAPETRARLGEWPAHEVQDRRLAPVASPPEPVNEPAEVVPPFPDDPGGDFPGLG